MAFASRENILLPFFVNLYFTLRVPPPQEGRFAIVTSVGSGMRWMQSYRLTCETIADDEIVWSWRPWAGAKSAGHDPAGDGDYEVTDTGESTNISVNTVAQGMSWFAAHL